MDFWLESREKSELPGGTVQVLPIPSKSNLMSIGMRGVRE
jgi:hypothetical protein